MENTQVYKPLEVSLLSVCGLQESIRAMRLPKDRQKENHTKAEDMGLAIRLIKAGADHAKFQRGVIAYVELKMQAGFMIEFETYRHGVECLSTSSSMHNELKMLQGSELADQKQKDISTKVYTRIVTVSYQALRNMYKARRTHRHPDWKIFCAFVETLPHFCWLIYPEVEASHTICIDKAPILFEGSGPDCKNCKERNPCQ